MSQRRASWVRGLCAFSSHPLRNPLLAECVLSTGVIRRESKILTLHSESAERDNPRDRSTEQLLLHKIGGSGAGEQMLAFRDICWRSHLYINKSCTLSSPPPPPSFRFQGDNFAFPPRARRSRIGPPERVYVTVPVCV